MKLALIRPNMGNHKSSDAMQPLAIGILAELSKGHDVVFYDDRTEDVPETIDADLIGMSVETFTAKRAYMLADRYRQQGIPVVMGGYHPTFLPDEALRHADAVVVGDAEGTWEEVLADFEKKELKKIYRSKNGSMTNVKVNRNIFKDKKYAPVEMVQYGRGCRFVCDFCSIHSFYGSNVRVRPVDRVQQELSEIDRRKLLFFVDDNLFSTIDNVKSLLKMLKPLKLNWSCQISIDIARDHGMLDLMAESGCKFVLIGFESLQPDNLKAMRKNWNHVSGPYSEVVKALHQRGIGIYGTFVFGYDHDTADTIRESLDFALESRLEIANFNPLTPTPASELYNRLKDEGRLISPEWWLDPSYKYGSPIFKPARITAEEMNEKCFEAKKEFYSWSSIGRRVLLSDTKFSLFGRSMSTIANIISRREIYNKQGMALGA